MTPSSSSPAPSDDILAHAGFVRGLARALVSGDADVDDVVQETWVAALGSKQSTIRSPRSWLASIVRRRAARHHRTRARMDKRHTEGARSVEVPTPEDLVARHELIQQVSAALAALPVSYRDVLVLRYYEELPPREVAKRLEIPVETARTRIRRGLVRLREILDEKHDGRRAAWAMPLAGLVSSGTATAGIGVVAVCGLAAAAILILGFALAPWTWGQKAPPPVEQAQHVPDEVPSPTLMGLGEPENEALDGSSPAAPSDTETEKMEEDPQPEDADAPMVEVVVRVVDEQGKPVEGIGLTERTLDPGGPIGGRHRHLGTTDGRGCAIVMVAKDAIHIGIERNDQWRCDEFHRLTSAGNEVVIRVTPNITVRGIVLDGDGAPVSGKPVFARYRVRTSPEITSLEVQQVGPTDDDGRFVAHVPAYAVEVRLSTSTGEGSVSVTIKPAEQREVVLHPTAKHLIRGTVWGPDGTAITRPDVDALPLDGGPEINGGIRSDRETNEFLVLVPSTGSYRLRFVPSRESSFAWPDPVQTQAPAEGVRIVCPRGHPVTGRIEGDDVDRFQVGWIRHREGDPRLMVRRFTCTDAAGRFALDGLLEGETTLYVYRPGDSRYGLLEGVRLPANDIVVELRRGLTIRGRIRGYTGRQGFNLSLSFLWRGPAIHAKVEGDGTFVITGLPPGSYGVRWQRAGKEADLDLEIEAGTEDVEVVLPEEVLRMGKTPEK